MAHLYKLENGEVKKQFVPPIDHRDWLAIGWSLTPPVTEESIAEQIAIDAGKLDLNTAKTEDLLALKIAPTKAAKILAGVPYGGIEEAIAAHPELGKMSDKITVIPVQSLEVDEPT